MKSQRNHHVTKKSQPKTVTILSSKRKLEEVDLPPKPRKRRRKIKEEDRAYRPRRSRRNHAHANPLHLRIKKNNKEKIVGLYNLENIVGVDRYRAALNIRKALVSLRGDKSRNIRILKRSATGTPVKVSTPGKTCYFKKKNVGSILFFSNMAPVIEREPVTEIDEENELFDSRAYQSVKACDSDIKRQILHITPEHIRAIARERSRAGRRPISQNQVMKKTKGKAKDASATLYAGATELFSKDQKWEWLHMLAYAILGKLGQDADNLVCGSFDANTDMIFAEAEINKMVAAYPNGFDLEVIARMVKGTQLCHKIEYIFHTDDFTLPFVFDAQTSVIPSLEQQDYFQALIDGLINTVNEDKENDAQADNLLTQERIQSYSPEPKGRLFYNLDSKAKRKLDYEEEKPAVKLATPCL
jgi:hypothetical protein